jgi:hypothetical protein
MKGNNSNHAYSRQKLNLFLTMGLVSSHRVSQKIFKDNFQRINFICEKHLFMKELL